MGLTGEQGMIDGRRPMNGPFRAGGIWQPFTQPSGGCAAYGLGYQNEPFRLMEDAGSDRLVSKVQVHGNRAAGCLV
jgi:hypothetical protein